MIVEVGIGVVVGVLLAAGVLMVDGRLGWLDFLRRRRP